MWFDKKKNPLYSWLLTYSDKWMLSETILIQTYMGIYRKPHIDYIDVQWNDRVFPSGSDGKESTGSAL